jgi:hypothetical protein
MDRRGVKQIGSGGRLAVFGGAVADAEAYYGSNPFVDPSAGPVRGRRPREKE